MLRSDGFSFCILDKNSNTVTVVRNLLFDTNKAPQQQLDFISNEFNNNELLQQKFDSINVTHNNNLSTQVPKPFFREDNLKDYLRYNLKVLENDFITYDSIENSEIINVYIPYVHINNFLFDKFGSFEYKHSSTILVESLLQISENSNTPHFFVNVENGFFQIVVIKRKKLLFYNSFNFKSKEDFIYYILFTAEQLHMNPEEFQLTFLGEIEKESELYTIVYQYVRNIDFFQSEIVSTNLEISKHSNFILLNQY